MIKRSFGWLALLVTAVAFVTIAPLSAQENEDVTVGWSNGLSITGPGYEVGLGGRIHADWAFYSAGDDVEEAVGELINGHEFRRARLFVEGTVYERLEFKAQFDFAGGDADFKDVYMGITDVPGIGGVRVGHFKEPFSLEVQTSSKYITFMERATPITTFFGDERNSGFMIGKGLDRYSWKIGAFQETGSDGVAQEEAWALTGRVTAVPVDQDGLVVHVGAAGSIREAPDDELRFRTRPETHLTPRFVDTGSFEASDVRVLGLEAMAIKGRGSVQGEFMVASPDVPGSDDPTLFGLYVYGSWFLKGGARNYGLSRRSARFERSRVDTPLGSGGGAVELALRYSHVDLVDGTIDGGKLNTVTAGLNWYLYPNARVMLNYVLADLNGVGNAHTFQTRFAVNF